MGEEEEQTGVIFKRSKILKDLDFLKDQQCIFFGKKRAHKWLEQVKGDTKFLTNLNVMDYSFILGIHDKDKHVNKWNQEEEIGNNARWKEGQLFVYERGGMSY